jgi:hypothetical protein
VRAMPFRPGMWAQRDDDLVRAKPWPLIVILAEGSVILGSHSVQTQCPFQ